MPYRILSTVISVAMFVGYFMPIVIKLKDTALASVVAGGIVFVLLDAWKALSNDKGS